MYGLFFASPGLELITVVNMPFHSLTHSQKLTPGCLFACGRQGTTLDTVDTFENESGVLLFLYYQQFSPAIYW
jgi:hypothetical protein